MGGSELANKSATQNDQVRTVVLLGRRSNGKSATGNSILGRRAFKSKSSSSGVTMSSELEQATMKNGQIINVVDTPGLFDFSVESEVVSKEIVKCVNMAKEGIHAMILVLSVKTRFSQEEEDAVRNLQALFGSKIYDYMIVVFTGGDELEDSEQTLEDYLGQECPQPLKDILTLCNNRKVLFDNKTKDEKKKNEQVQQLLTLINVVIAQNGGQPYTNELFAEIQKVGMKLETTSLRGLPEQETSKEQLNNLDEEELKRVTDMIVSKARESTIMLEQQLEVERAARVKIEEMTQNHLNKSNHEISRLRKKLAKEQRETKRLQEMKRRGFICTIM